MLGAAPGAAATPLPPKGEFFTSPSRLAAGAETSPPIIVAARV